MALVQAVGRTNVPTPRAVGPRLPRVLVERPRLTSLLDADVPLTVLRAPLGFGKSTLVAQYLRERPDNAARAAWIRLGADFADRAQFWAAVLRALEDVPDLVVPDGPNPRARVRGALLQATDALTLVLDEFEHVTAQGVDDELLTILRDSRHLRLVVCLRG
ncbi:MAG TPA: AAA family ATPase, partial [Jatrophihabitans sp.]|nr:AAA family ATPase [Jatrophihabitans sp.]